MVLVVADIEIAFLKIELYSGHPEVVAAAEVLVAHIASQKDFLKDRNGCVIPPFITAVLGRGLSRHH